MSPGAIKAHSPIRGSENGNRYSPTGREVLTRSGMMIDVVAPRPDQVRLGDIAVSLAKQVRFTGHCPLQPTIAEHSLAVEHIVGLLLPEKGDGDLDPWPTHRRVRLAGLMHDAAEYIVSDLNGAVKKDIRMAWAVSRFDVLETRAMRAIEQRFDCAPLICYEDLVHEADCLACAYEMSWRDWCADAQPPDWLVRDEHVRSCYRHADGGEAAFHRRALTLGVEPDPRP